MSFREVRLYCKNPSDFVEDRRRIYFKDVESRHATKRPRAACRLETRLGVRGAETNTHAPNAEAGYSCSLMQGGTGPAKTIESPFQSEAVKAADPSWCEVRTGAQSPSDHPKHWSRLHGPFYRIRRTHHQHPQLQGCQVPQEVHWTW